MRSLTAKEFQYSEQVKFAVLYRLDYLQTVDTEAIQVGLSQKLPNGVLEKCEEWISNASLDMNRKLSIEEIRNIRATFYAEHYIAKSKFAYKDPVTGEIYYYIRKGLYKKNGRILILVNNP